MNAGSRRKRTPGQGWRPRPKSPTTWVTSTPSFSGSGCSPFVLPSCATLASDLSLFAPATAAASPPYHSNQGRPASATDKRGNLPPAANRRPTFEDHRSPARGQSLKILPMTKFRLGPGLLVSAAFIGPGTIVTASTAGAGYGAALLWAILFSVAATIVPAGHGGPGRYCRGPGLGRVDPGQHHVAGAQRRGGPAYCGDHPAGQRRLPGRQPAGSLARLQRADRPGPGRRNRLAGRSCRGVCC